MSARGGGGLKRERKSRSCENLLHGSSNKNYHKKKCLEKASSHEFLDAHRSHSHFECPVEMQTSKPLLPDEVRRIINDMETEFLSRRKILISGLPPNWTSIDATFANFLEDISSTIVSKPKDGAVRVVFNSAPTTKSALSLINSKIFYSRKLIASYGHPDSLLFVGNLPYTYTREDLLKLFRNCGEIIRCFIVCSLESGLSKGYGFVEFSRREEAMIAKQQNATKVIGLRSLRVDFSDNGMQTVEDLHSQTLFVDRLPKGFVEDGTLSEHFKEYGTVNFCQVAVAIQTGVSRGFAFVDMSTSLDAERAQLACNGGTFRFQEIRVSFGMPCRHGACILQHRSSNQPMKMCGVLPPVGYSYPPLQDISQLPYQPFCDLTNVPMFDFTVHNLILPSSIMGPYSIADSVVECQQQQEERVGIGKSISAPDVIQLPSSPPPLLITPASQLTPSSQPSQLTQSSLVTQPSQLTQPSQFTPLSPPFSRLAPSSLITQLSQLTQPSLVTQLTQSSPPPSRLTTIVSLQRKRAVNEYSTEGLYDQEQEPYIGQHQQGIPYLHPLKRIRTYLY